MPVSARAWGRDSARMAAGDDAVGVVGRANRMTPPARHTIEARRFAFGGWLRSMQRHIRAGRRAAAMLTKPCVSVDVIMSIISRSAVLILEREASITTSATFGHPAWWTGSPNHQFFKDIGASTWDVVCSGGRRHNQGVFAST